MVSFVRFFFYSMFRQMTEERMHRAGRRKMREGCRDGERLLHRQQHHHKQASFSQVRRWPISEQHVKSASPPAESEGLSPPESWKVQ
jgi:hypothetical protein